LETNPSASFHSAPRANFRRAYGMALAGAIGALIGLFWYVELVHTNNIWVRDCWAGIAIGGAIGFVLNAAEPFRDGAWLKLSRMGTWGGIAGAIGGAIGLLIGEFVLGGLRGGLLGRSISWSILGLGIGISQGLAHRSLQRLIFGVIGGATGGFIGGFLFEALRVALAERFGYAPSQALGIVVLGAGLGLFLALVEQALRRAWLQVLSGRQEGRIFLLTNRTSTIGLDERAHVGLFGDSQVARRHAEIIITSSGYALCNRDAKARTRVNGTQLSGERILADGDKIELGGTRLVFHKR
jgi:hypothetical protein